MARQFKSDFQGLTQTIQAGADPHGKPLTQDLLAPSL